MVIWLVDKSEINLFESLKAKIQFDVGGRSWNRLLPAVVRQQKATGSKADRQVTRRRDIEAKDIEFVGRCVFFFQSERSGGCGGSDQSPAHILKE